VRGFPDSNVWISAFTTHGLCTELIRRLLKHHGRQWELLSAIVVREEVTRILATKFDADKQDLALAQRTMAIASVTTAPLAAQCNLASIPDPDDVPIIAAALAAEADLFVTGDKPLLALEHIESLQIVSPRTAWERLITSGDDSV
jgi:putative PIN family toxin of toxin-antitoxin system